MYRVPYDRQFGFRRKHSTCHAVNYSVDNILKEIEKKNHVIGVFIDLSKAFDTIEHGKLIDKLDYYGIRGPAHDILRSYLSERTHVTKFQTEKSGKCAVEYGVPQGSVLGPLLFLVYINDIVNSTNLGEFVMFADDTNIFVTGKTADETYRKANVVLREVEKYMLDNQLHINVGKSCYMHFKPDLSRAKQTSARVREYDGSNKLFLCDKKLQKVRHTKFLGVMIDDQLNWEAHIDHLVNKLNAALITIKRIKKYIPASEYLKIYNALFLSHLSYCISCWGGIPDYKLARVFSLQKRCIRLLFGKTLSFDHHEFYQTCARTRTYDENMADKSFCLEHTKPLFNEHSLLSLRNLYLYFTFMEVFKVLKFRTPISIHGLFRFCPRNEKLLLMVPLVKLELTKQNFVFKSTTVWNDLIANIFEKCIPTDRGLVIPGSSTVSDLAASMGAIKSRVRANLLINQKLGDPILW